jgi:hypothetical protein
MAASGEDRQGCKPLFEKKEHAEEDDHEENKI